jgi:hypothetical protein
MVSALTDRLFSGYSSSGTNSSGGAASGKNASSGGGTKPANDSGYSADREQRSAGSTETPPLFYIDLLTRHRKRACSTSADNSSLASDEKRARITDSQELNYLAHMVSQELGTAGGHAYPKINSKKPRMLPTHANVNMGGVTLVHSKDYFAVAPRKSSQSSHGGHNMMSPELCVDALQSIIKACAPHYQTTASFRAINPPFSKPTADLGTSDSASTTSSVTEDEAEDATENPSISMGQALTISKQPRYVCVCVCGSLLSFQNPDAHMVSSFLSCVELLSWRMLPTRLFTAMLPFSP